jgi:hypothetical protein
MKVGDISHAMAPLSVEILVPLRSRSCVGLRLRRRGGGRRKGENHFREFAASG